MSKRGELKQFGAFLTPIQIFEKYILPYIIDELHNYCWVDMFCGEGNLILPILKFIPEKERIDFFQERIFLFDIQEEMIEKSISNAEKLGIPRNLAAEKIVKRDTLKNYPDLGNCKYPIFHITNPPYAHISRIGREKDLMRFKQYFQKEVRGLQDIYQIAMMNDIRAKLERMIYIIPTNFLFSRETARQIRENIFLYYDIDEALIFEDRIFEHTGMHVGIFFFRKKKQPKRENIKLDVIKFKAGTSSHKSYILQPEFGYKAEFIFDQFLSELKSLNPIRVSFCLDMKEVELNPGPNEIEVLDANSYRIGGNKYLRTTIRVNDELAQRIKSNILFFRNTDSGSSEGRAGLYSIEEVFQVEGILVTKQRMINSPTQIFFDPTLSKEEQIILRDYLI